MSHKEHLEVDYLARAEGETAIRVELDTGAAVELKIFEPPRFFEAKALVMGITFKEDVTDIRNSKVVDVIKELADFGVKVDVVDPAADHHQVKEEYNLEMIKEPHGKYDAIILAVNHKEYQKLDEAWFAKYLADKGLIVDVKGILRGKIKEHSYWSL
jgi:UDP-N-acetyl-D-galactosamine dehydrogenase